MRLLSRIHYKQEMNEMEIEISRQMNDIIGIHPINFEFLLMVDSDTVVFPDSLNHLVSTMANDSKIMGLCGETKIENSSESWVTMIQVYEYFISHHLSKSFESLFGSVTCLPGCFCMYRLKNNNQPLLISQRVVKDYSEQKVDTLHMKNLLTLGEDRYLTTLMLKNFPKLKTTFNPKAKCNTVVPDQWSVLLSQRRRWINSTVHNLFELLSLAQMCGCCCFSMRFVILLDLFSTVAQPAGVN
jgi:chitin synthase